MAENNSYHFLNKDELLSAASFNETPAAPQRLKSLREREREREIYREERGERIDR